MKDKKIIAFLRNSLIVVVFVCILIFSVMTALMACWTQQAVRDISDIYMKEMNVQLQQKFSSIIELRLQQVSGVIMTNPPEESRYEPVFLEDLRKRAEARNFAYMGFLIMDIVVSGTTRLISLDNYRIISWINGAIIVIFR